MLFQGISPFDFKPLSLLRKEPYSGATYYGHKKNTNIGASEVIQASNFYSEEVLTNIFRKFEIIFRLKIITLFSS